MASVGKRILWVFMALFVSVMTSMLFKMNWIWFIIHTISVLMLLKHLISKWQRHQIEKLSVAKFYEMMTSFLITYRESRQILSVVQTLERDYGFKSKESSSQGSVSFEELREIHHHYLWQSVVNLIEMDVLQGDPQCITQLYDLEEEIDGWYQAMMLHTQDLIANVRTMSVLVLFSIFVAWMVMNMLHTVMPMYIMPAYQLVVGVFVLMLQSFFILIFSIFNQSLILEVECVL